MRIHHPLGGWLRIHHPLGGWLRIHHPLGGGQVVDLWQTAGAAYGRNGSMYSAMLYGSEVGMESWDGMTVSARVCIRVYVYMWICGCLCRNCMGGEREKGRGMGRVGWMCWYWGMEGIRTHVHCQAVRVISRHDTSRPLFLYYAAQVMAARTVEWDTCRGVVHKNMPRGRT